MALLWVWWLYFLFLRFPFAPWFSSIYGTASNKLKASVYVYVCVHVHVCVHVCVHACGQVFVVPVHLLTEAKGGC